MISEPTIPGDLFSRYQRLQQYVGWTERDEEQVRDMAEHVRSAFPALVDDFYETLLAHPATRQVIRGGQQQIERLKVSLHGWLTELFAGRYDRAYVARRWQVGWRHVDIGLDQVFTNVALSRLRAGLVRAIEARWSGDRHPLLRMIESLNKLIDLDLAIIEDAYQTEYSRRRDATERLATIGQVAGGVAHELRNPLNVIKTSVYYLLNAKQLTPEKWREHLQRIERQVGIADSVITALSEFARLPAPRFQPLAVADLLRESLQRSPLRNEILVQMELPADLPPVSGDAGQLSIVLGNLIRNALEAMPEGGTLTITASAAGLAAGAKVSIAIRDTGVGIRPEHLSRITEPLFTTKARGIGLGLAIARAILDKHQGELKVQSEPQRGSTFTLVLPAAV